MAGEKPNRLRSGLAVDELRENPGVLRIPDEIRGNVGGQDAPSLLRPGPRTSHVVTSIPQQNPLKP